MLQSISKSESLEALLLEEIPSKYSPGEKIPSEADLAKQMGTSRPTVHKVLSNLVARGMLYRVNGVGTFVSEPKPTARSVLAVVLPCRESFDMNFNPGWLNAQLMLEGFSSAAREGGYGLDLVYVNPDKTSPEEGAEQIIAGGAAGAAFPGWSISYKGITDRLMEKGRVCVVRTPAPIEGLSTVYGRLESGVFEAITALVRAGRKRIMCFELGKESQFERIRFDGYSKALMAGGIEVDEKLVCACGGLPDDGYKAMKHALESGLEVDAVFAGTDFRAAGIMKAIKEAGLSIPDDIAIVGSDNVPECELMDPPLASVEYPMLEMGRQMYKILEEILSGTAPEPIVKPLSCRFVKRESAGL